MSFPTVDPTTNRPRQMWERAGKPHGRDGELWHRAEQELQEMDDPGEIAIEPPPAILPG